MAFHKDLFLVCNYSTYIYVTFFYVLQDLDIASYTDNTTIYTVKENK